MKTKLTLTFLTLILFFHCATALYADSLLVGTWKGTSICQVKNSPCHDEIAAYHIQKGEKPGVYRMIMNKIVNGKEEDMGVLDYGYDPASNTLTCSDEAHNTVWRFKVTGKTMDGTLYHNGQLYRVIKLSKETSP